MSGFLKEAFLDLLPLAHRLLEQTRTGKNKLYSIHAPEVECIAIVREREQHLLHEIMEGVLQKQKAELAAATEAMAETFKRQYLRMLAGSVAVIVAGLCIAAWL